MQKLEAIVHSTIKEANEKRVLNTAMQLRMFTKNELVRQSGVSMTTVSKIVDDYTNRGLLNMIGQGELKTAGRKPSVYQFVSEAVYSVGVSFRRGTLEFMIVDLELNEIFAREQAYDFSDISDYNNYFSGIVAGYIKESGIDASRIAGIGFTFPWMEQFDFATLEKTKVFVKQAFEYENLQIPVIFENRGNAAVLAEMHARKTPTANGVYVSVADGIDVGVLLNGNVFHSRQMFARSMGHMIVEVDGRDCRCGGKGCWDSYVSITALIKECNEAGYDVNDMEQIVELCDGGNSKIPGIFKQYAKMLAVGLSNIILAYAPEQLIIGGKLMKHEQRLLPLLKEHLSQDDYAKLSFSRLDVKTALVGSAMLPIQKVLYMGEHTI